MKKLILTLALVAMGSAAYAQTGTIDANATVQAPLTVAGVDDIEFGDVLPGVNKTIARTVAEAGSFTVTGQASTPVYLNFDLPTNLISGLNNLAIVFSATSAGVGTTNVQGDANAADPNSEVNATLSAGGELWVWLGAEVQPTITQVAGAYTAEITLTVTYD